MTVVGIAFSPSFVCLFFRTISKHNVSRITILDTYYICVLKTGLFYGQKVKGQGSRVAKQCMFAHS